MNKIVMAIVVLVLIASAGFVIMSGDNAMTVADSAQQTNSLDSAAQPAQESASTAAEPAEQASTASDGEYIDFSEQALADASGNQRVVFFHAEWCSTCKFFENQIKSAGVPSGITILEADYDNDTELKAKYGVSVQSTFVLLDDSGEVAQTWPFASGLRSAQDLYDAVL